MGRSQQPVVSVSAGLTTPHSGPCRKVQLPSVAKPAALAAITNLLATLPAQAEAGKIFDFNLTLPVMATQFLLLMVFLDKFWFTPVGQVLDNRDKLLREQLGSVKVHSLRSTFEPSFPAQHSWLQPTGLDHSWHKSLLSQGHH